MAVLQDCKVRALPARQRWRRIWHAFYYAPVLYTFRRYIDVAPVASIA